MSSGGQSRSKWPVWAPLRVWMSSCGFALALFKDWEFPSSDSLSCFHWYSSIPFLWVQTSMNVLHIIYIYKKIIIESGWLLISRPQTFWLILGRKDTPLRGRGSLGFSTVYRQDYHPLFSDSAWCPSLYFFQSSLAWPVQGPSWLEGRLGSYFIFTVLIIRK